VASVAPGGGRTPGVLIKSANDGFNVYVLLRWNDSVGPSYASNNELYRAPNGTLVPLTVAATATVTQLYYNSTYYYPDRAAMLWFIANASKRASAPVMQLGTNGAITGGAADIWHWQSNPTDNSPLDTGFPGGYTDPAGKPIYPADNLSYAEDDYTNMTGFWVTAGSFGPGAPNLDRYADPYVVHAGNAFSNATKQWTVEMIRSFTTSAARYRVQLAMGASYFVAFAVWNGRLGESAEFKSVSQWFNLTITNQPPMSPPAAVGGISPTLAAVVAAGTLIAGVAVGMVLRWKQEGDGPPQEEARN
jgi:cytochrome b558/566 subunit A